MKTTFLKKREETQKIKTKQNKHTVEVNIMLV